MACTLFSPPPSPRPNSGQAETIPLLALEFAPRVEVDGLLEAGRAGQADNILLHALRLQHRREEINLASRFPVVVCEEFLISHFDIAVTLLSCRISCMYESNPRNPHLPSFILHRIITGSHVEGRYDLQERKMVAG